MEEVVIVAGARTAVGAFNGAFATVPDHQLGKVASEAALARAKVEAGEVSETILGQVLTAPFAGASHRARALIAASVFHRYTGDEDVPPQMNLSGLLDKEDERRALVLGLAWRFAFSLSASAAGELAHYRLRVTPSKVILDVPTRREAIAGEPVQKRLGALAAALNRKGEILIG